MPIAYFIATRPKSSRNIWLFLITVPFWTSLLIRTIAILEIIRKDGIVNKFLLGAGLVDEPVQFLFTDFAIGMGMTYVDLPLMVLPVYASVERPDCDLLEACYDLDATRWAAYRRVVLPLIKPGVIAGSILVFVPSLVEYVTPRILGGGNLMIGKLIELQFGQGRTWPLGAALSLTLLLMIVGSSFSTSPSPAKRKTAMDKSGPQFNVRRMPGVTPIAILGFVFLYMPLGVLIFYSFSAGDVLGRWEGFSWRWYGTALHNELIREAALRSLLVASVAATVATMAGIATTRSTSFKARKRVYLVISQPLMVSEIVMTVSLLILFALIWNLTGVSGLGYLIAAHTTFCIPFAYMPIRARLEGMDSNLEAAAGDLCADAWVTFRRVTLPLLFPAVLSGLMLSFVISLDNVVISQFVKSAGQETLPTYMLGQLRRGISPEVYAVSAMMLTLSVVIVSAFFILTNKKN
ncbi:ABC transporter permease subunit [Primorskyibacter sp. 2E107]|uniref:ABC transporter permease subunit n=1 Tax=Primorskyibacter sp. 2E107 TaxID=3403458 RepID=UPI003AF82370